MVNDKGDLLIVPLRSSSSDSLHFSCCIIEKSSLLQFDLQQNI